MRNPVTFLLVLSFGLLLSACSQEIKTQPVDLHKVIKPVLKDVTYQHEYVADIHSVRFVEVRSRIKGQLESIFADEGQTVVEGQLLFSLSYRGLEKELQKAKATLKSAMADLKVAEVELKNVQLLARRNIVSDAELAVTRAKAEALQANVEHARANQEHAELKSAFSRIHAPFTGTINRIPYKVGSLISEGDMLTSISDNSEIFAYFNLSETDYLNYAKANDQHAKVVNLKLADDSLYDYEGRIEMVESEIDQSTGNIAFRARFPNPEGLLKHGSNAKVVVSKKLMDAMFVPQRSTFEIQDKLYVYVVDENGLLKQRNVVPKMRFPDYYVLESGLANDDRILYEGVENVRDGEAIKPELVDLNTMMAATAKP